MTNATDPAGRLVFGDDDSAGAGRAWDWVCSQQWPDWQIEVLTVTPAEASLTDVFDYDPPREFEPESPRLVPASMAALSVTHVTTAFDPRIVLGEIKDADLIVVGVRGDGILKALGLGSAAEWLIRRSLTPVVIASQARPVHSVLLCVDERGGANAAAEVLSQMPWIHKAAVTVLAVRDERGMDLPEVTHATQVLKAVGAKVQVSTSVPDPQVVAANPKYKIFEFIDRYNPDLVVVGTHGRTGIARLVTGSTAAEVAQYVSSAVLVVHDHYRVSRSAA